MTDKVQETVRDQEPPDGWEPPEFRCSACDSRLDELDAAAGRCASCGAELPADELEGLARELDAQPADELELEGPSPRVRHPEIEVRLLGTDGNAFAVLGRVRRALRDAGLPPEEVTEFMLEATSGDYDHLLATCFRWVEVS